MKFCTRCKTDKELSCFYKAKRYSDGLQLYCKSCHNEYNKESMAKKPDKYRAIRKKSKQTLRKKMDEWKQDKSCVQCGESDIACLDFHHTDKDSKDLNVSNATSMEMFLREADKCIVLCANCHRKLHYYESRVREVVISASS